MQTTANQNDTLEVCPEDLTGVVQNLSKTHGGAPKSPNDPYVVGLLQSALALFAECYLEVRADHPGPHGSSLGVMNVVTAAAVTKKFNAMVRNNEINHEQITQKMTARKVGTYWRSISEFHDDALRYLYRPAVHQVRQFERRKLAQKLVVGPFSETVEQLAAAEMQQATIDPFVRLQPVLRMLFPQHTLLKELTGQVYLRQKKFWVEMYDYLWRAYGLNQEKTRTLSDLQDVLDVILVGHIPRIGLSEDLQRTSSGESTLVSQIRDAITIHTGQSWDELAGLVGNPDEPFIRTTS